MTKKKTKKVLIISGVLAAIAVAAGAMYHFASRDSKPELSKVTLAEIISDSKIPDKEYNNLDFSNAVLNIPDAEKFYKLYPSEESKLTPEQCDANCYEMFDIVFADVKKEHPDITFIDIYGNPLKEGETSREYDNDGNHYESSIRFFVSEDEQYSCWFDPRGSFLIYSSQAVHVVATGSGGRGTVEEIIHLDRGDGAPDTKYIVGGEEYSPAQALEFAEKYMSEKIGKFLPTDTVTPSEMIIIKDPETDNYMYKIEFEYVFEGTPYFHIMLPEVVDESQPEFGNVYMTISAPDRAAEIFNQGTNSYPNTENDGEYEDKYISLDDAVNLVSEYIAPQFTQNISEVTIKYSRKGNDEEKYLRPYWCFIIDYANPMQNLSICGNAIFVDMQTGEVLVYDKSLSRYKSSINDALESEKLL